MTTQLWKEHSVGAVQSVNTEPAEQRERSLINSIGLALSGGGSRATLFHLGVIRFLSEAMVLGLVKQICSVSGGSVFSAHLVLNWERYLQALSGPSDTTNEPFYDVTRSLIHFAQYDVRGKILRRLFLYLPARIVGLFSNGWRFSWSNTGRLQSFYEKLLYGRSELMQLQQSRGAAPSTTGPNESRPLLYLLATNLTKLDLCYFNHATFQPAVFATRSVPSISAATTKISYAVAASSAFPGFFGPLEVNEKTLKTTLPTLEIERQQIADGGIFDNMGLRMLRVLDSKGRGKGVKCDLNIVCDAGRSHTWEPHLKFPRVVSTPLRATDVLMARVGQLEQECIPAGLSEGKYQFINIARQSMTEADQPEVEETSGNEYPGQMSPVLSPAANAFFELLPHVRTDFDRFSPLEIRALVQHGYISARQALWKWRDRLGIPEALFFQTPWDPISGGHEELGVDHNVVDELYDGRSRSLGFWRFWADPLACIPMLVFLALFAFVGIASSHYWNERLARTENAWLASAIATEASAHRRHAYDVLRHRRRPDGFWGRYNAAETWTTSQAITALCLAPETTPDRIGEYVQMIRNRFESYDYDSTLNAWSSDTFRTSPEQTGLSGFKGVVHSIPSLWLLNAIAAAKHYDDGVSTRPNQQVLIESFEKLRTILRKFEGTDGGWRLYLTDGGDESNTFSTCYALLGLLEAQKAGLRYTGTDDGDRDVIVAGISWLEKHFYDDGDSIGWTESGAVERGVKLGLTCQVFTFLLRAESAGFRVSARLVSRIPVVLESQIAHNVLPTIERVDVGQFRSRPVHFVVYPWAVSSCNEYGQYLERRGEPATTLVKYRRILHELVSNLMLEEGEDERNTYKFALTIYALARI